MPSDEYVMQIKPEFDISQLNKEIGRIRAELFGRKDKHGNDMKDLMGNIGTDDPLTKISDNVQNIEQILRTAYGGKFDLSKIDATTDRKRGELDKLYDLLKQSKEAPEGVSFLTKASKGLKSFAGAVTKASGILVATTKFVAEGVNKAKEIINDAAKNANTLNPFGAFGSMSTRNTMARFGMSATQAVGHSKALSYLGLSESDLGRMNAVQRRAYNSLISTYEEGLSKIDPNKLKEYFGALEEFQLKQAEFKIKLQTSIMKLFAESDAFNRLIGRVEKFFDVVIDFMDSDAVKFFFDTFIGFLDSLVQFATWFLQLFGGGKSSSEKPSNTTNNNTSTNTFYIYGSDARDNKALARDIIQGQQQGAMG